MLIEAASQPPWKNHLENENENLVKWTRGWATARDGSVSKRELRTGIETLKQH